MFKSKVVRYALLIALFHYLVTEAVRPYLSLYAEACGASNVEIGYISSTYSLIQVFSALLVGKALDRWGVRKPALLGGVTFVVGALILSVSKTVAPMMVASALFGISHGILLLAVEAVTVGVKNPNARASSIGILTSFNAIGIFIGPMLGGWMQSLWNAAGSFIGCAVIATVPAALTLFLPNRVENHSASSVSKKNKAGENIFTLLRDRNIVNNMILSACTFFALDVMSTYLSLYCASTAGLNETAIGYILSAKGVAQLISRFALGYLCKTFRQDRVFASCLLIGAVSTAAIGFASSYWGIMLLAILIGAALGLANPLTLLNVSDVSTEENRSRVLALRLTCGYAAQSTSPIVFGVIADSFGLSTVFWGSGIVMLACVFCSSWMRVKTTTESAAQ